MVKGEKSLPSEVRRSKIRKNAKSRTAYGYLKQTIVAIGPNPEWGTEFGRTGTCNTKDITPARTTVDSKTEQQRYAKRHLGQNPPKWRG
jgi:hypothetical protein